MDERRGEAREGEIERLREVNARLAAAEDRYRSLFLAMSEGMALCEMLFDASGDPCDFRYLDVNPAFELQTGLSRDQVVGKRVREAIPTIESVWIERYGRVAQTGIPDLLT